MELPPTGHEPVLLGEVLSFLQPKPPFRADPLVVVDCTVGRGGHALALANCLDRQDLILCLDVDPRNLEFARSRLAGVPCTARFFHANFAELKEVLASAGVGAVDFVLADLGLSTNQLSDPTYGLSFSQAMPLDMRLDPRLERSAADLVNQLPEEELARVLYELAQERYARRIARKIVEARRVWPITTTDRLADIVRSAIPPRGRAPLKIDPATRCFLALRMLTGRELDNLAALLDGAPSSLKPGGRLAVISFQSSEDRLVKQAFRSAQQAGILSLLTKKPLTPSDAEIARNPRSRSAKLRVAQKR